MIVPALLTDKIEYLKEMIGLCRRFTGYVQIDIMDGRFVPSCSVTLRDLEALQGPIGGEAHLMVDDPLIWITPFKKLGVQAIVYHFEIKADHKKIIAAIKKQEMRVGLAVNPGTEIGDFEYLVKDVDSILFLSVNPGFYGAPFIPEVLTKIKEFKMRYPATATAIDGGVKLDNLSDILATRVDMVCVGSAILKAVDPAAAYSRFLERFKKAGVKGE